jgi:hypothetical protein
MPGVQPAILQCNNGALSISWACGVSLTEVAPLELKHE